MPSVGVRKLKNQTSQVIREVRENGVAYVITYRGEPVAIMRPLNESERQHLQQAEREQAAAGLKALAGEIAAAWQSEKSGVELISEQRR